MLKYDFLATQNVRISEIGVGQGEGKLLLLYCKCMASML